jgi:hypothetical protein
VSHGRHVLRWAAATLLGAIITLLSTFVGERSAPATYPDIMGCETSCRVTATGWPLIFVRDYKGMSVVGTADVLEVVFAADRFDLLPFIANVIAWTLVSLALLRMLRRR